MRSRDGLRLQNKTNKQQSGEEGVGAIRLNEFQPADESDVSTHTHNFLFFFFGTQLGVYSTLASDRHVKF